MTAAATRGTQLRGLRIRAGLSQTEAAERIGIPAPVLSAYERGRREPRVDIFFRATEALGFRIDITPVPATLDLRVPDAAEKATLLARVCAIGMALPRRDRGPLLFPPPHTWRKP
ncbi:helix-turn-helix transcriptional regulator [Nocardioides sp. AE5]|uniref:helix-turn-helix domain-containing protein n=1 Tax=Nocardioides sp. AE5 TaxID=2962573 RepID=UPI0028815EDA|nr:helix-turn-helix transcriptional regulator [Nocardioides sp. AE5]MDT0203442.1 helix-turn-helix transcriptional regulator [Nocardioides sp. AE5]